MSHHSPSFLSFQRSVGKVKFGREFTHPYLMQQGCYSQFYKPVIGQFKIGTDYNGNNSWFYRMRSKIVSARVALLDSQEVTLVFTDDFASFPYLFCYRTLTLSSRYLFTKISIIFLPVMGRSLLFPEIPMTSKLSFRLQENQNVVSIWYTLLFYTNSSKKDVSAVINQHPAIL